MSLKWLKRAEHSASRQPTVALGRFCGVILAVILLTTGCSMQSNEEGFYTGEGRVKQAEARATEVAVDIAEADAAIDRQIRLLEQEAEREARVTEVAAQAASVQTQAESKARAISALGKALSGAIYVAVFGLTVAMAIVALGRATADVKRAMADAKLIRIGVEPSTMLPPPLVITDDGWLIDTRSGERARLRDTVGVNKLRLAATTHATEVALLAAAEREIAKQAKSAEPGDALMGAAGAVPLLDVGSGDDGSGGAG